MKYGSVCSGIESASIAWEPLGLEPAWFSEIEKFPCEVLAHHWPEIPNLGDMTNLPELVRMGLIDAPDILVGGTPCQAFSVAGKGDSLDDDRGQLTLTYVDLLNAIDEQRENDECVAVWENVPGVLNTKDNAFGCFLGELSGSGYELEPGERPELGKSNKLWKWNKTTQHHRAKWANAGCVFGPKRAVAWRIINAQYFGVAQRRRRVFIVASARKGFDPTKILFEFEGLRRDIAPSRKTGKSFTNCITAGIGDSDRDAQCDNLVTGSHWDNANQPHPTLNQSNNIGGIGLSNQELFSQRGANMVMAHCQGGAEVNVNGISPTLNCNHEQPIVANCLQTQRVRRLMPVECERLQGFPDCHTDVRINCPDGPRYKAIGNSKAVPCIQWIGVRLIAHMMGLL